METDKRTLEQLREELQTIDDQMMALLSSRQQLAEEVYARKEENIQLIYDQEQEKKKLDQVRSSEDPLVARYGAPLESTLMRLSRARQYALARPKSLDWELGRQIKHGLERQYPIQVVATQGNAFSYSAKAATILYPDRAYFPHRTFEDAILSVVKGQADAAVLPLENTTAGTVDDVYQLIQSTNLYITDEVKLSVKHRLLAAPGTSLEQIHYVTSHPQALAQCSKVIKARGWETVESLNTAFAAQDVAERNDPAWAAIGTQDAADAYKLEVLDSDINDIDVNQTRFIVVRRNLQIAKDSDQLALLLRLPHSAGSLVGVMNLFSDHDINLTKIQSSPIPRNPWEYYFYINCEAKPDSESVLDVLYQLQHESTELRLLGWYKESEPGR